MRIIQMIDHDRRHALHALLICGFGPAIAGQDYAARINEYRGSEPELSDDRGNLLDLLGAVHPGVARVWLQLVDKTPGNNKFKDLKGIVLFGHRRLL